jgi:hypothetical protein
LKKRTDDEVKQYRLEKEITVKAERDMKPVTTFDEASFPKYLRE